MKTSTKPPEIGWFGIERKWWTLAVVGAGTFMSALDGSVVNTALPIIGKSTGASVSTLEWIVLIYLLVVSSSLLVFGRLADIYGQRWIYVSGLAVFIAGSALSGFAPGVGTLIIFRGIQALGAAMLFALGPAVLTGAFPGRERGRALGMQATVTYLGLATGPALGGFITQHLGWPWIFFINAPIGLLVIPVAFYAIRPMVSKSDQPFDPAGALTLAVTLAALLFALSKGNDMGWGNPLIIATMAIGVVSLAAFIFIETRIAHPVLDLKLFSNKIFSASTAAAFLNYLTTTSVTFLMPFYLINASGYRVADAGLVLISTPVVMAIVAGPAGALSDKIGYRIPATIGMFLTAAGVLLLRTLQPGSPPSTVVPHLALIGLGVGLFTSPNNSALMGAAPGNRRGVAGAILAAARNMGFAIGTALAGLIYTIRLHSLSHSAADAHAITRAMQDATSLIALAAIIGAFISLARNSNRQ